MFSRFTWTRRCRCELRRTCWASGELPKLCISAGSIHRIPGSLSVDVLLTIIRAGRAEPVGAVLSVSKESLYTEDSVSRGAVCLSAPRTTVLDPKSGQWRLYKPLGSGSGTTKPDEFGAMVWHRYVIFAGKA